MPSMTADGLVSVETLVLHSSGQWITSTCKSHVDNGKQMNAIQGVGSAITYLRRYSLASVFGVPFGDDTDATPQRQQKPRQQRAATPPPPAAKPAQPAAKPPPLADDESARRAFHAEGKRVYGADWDAKRKAFADAKGLSSSNDFLVTYVKNNIMPQLQKMPNASLLPDQPATLPEYGEPPF